MTEAAQELYSAAHFLGDHPCSSAYRPFRGVERRLHRARRIWQKTPTLLVIAPATAAAIARLALGLADDLMGLVALSTCCPDRIAPAMEERMLHHPATQAHLLHLAERGVTIVDPAHGRLASGAFGEGRMASPESVIAAVKR